MSDKSAPELYGSSIYWHETSRRDPNPSVQGARRCDVAIVGGGYTGLWTAYHLLEADPSLNVAVVERESIGFGASGRNGGFAMTLLDLSLAELRRNQGDEAAVAAHRAVATSVDEIGATIDHEGIDCEWRHGGLMVVATNPAQRVRLAADRAAAEGLGLDGFTWLSADEARDEVHSPTYLAALREDHCGVLHPAKLARGLAEVVERRGATIYEQTAVSGIEETRGGIRVSVAGGHLDADQVVLATNAWSVSDANVGRKVMPLYTYIVLTEPLSDEQWESVGWDSHCGIEDKRNFVHYYRRTVDGRILWGGSDGVVYRGGSIRAAHDRHDGVFERLRGTFGRTFPQLGDVRFTHQWGGPVAITADFVPDFGTLLNGRLHYGVGYNGHGVAPSHTGGKILRDKVLGVDGELGELCFVDRRLGRYPGGPVVWAGAELSRRALRRQDDAMERGDPGAGAEPRVIGFIRKLG